MPGTANNEVIFLYEPWQWTQSEIIKIRDNPIIHFFNYIWKKNHYPYYK